MKAIPLTDGREVIVDDDVYDELSRYHWYPRKSKKRYSVACDKGPGGAKVRMPRVIMNASPDYYVHHINGDFLDNRRENLYLVSREPLPPRPADKQRRKQSASYNGPRTPEECERDFWSRVDKKDDSECWEWQGAIRSAKSGYGCMRWLGGKVTHAHRISWVLHNGPIPEGMLVCHKCDNPPCVNPNHLFLGTVLDNARDMVAKGRSNWGGRRTPVLTDGD